MTDYKTDRLVSFIKKTIIAMAKIGLIGATLLVSLALASVTSLYLPALFDTSSAAYAIATGIGIGTGIGLVGSVIFSATREPAIFRYTGNDRDDIDQYLQTLSRICIIGIAVGASVGLLGGSVVAAMVESAGRFLLGIGVLVTLPWILLMGLLNPTRS